jgi:hypothetical protein
MKEQAIKYFKAFRKIFCEDHLKYCPKDSIAYQATLKEKEFYDMAIKALEQEPCEDCVSRQAVLARINDWWGIASTSGEPTLCDCIRELPPVTPTTCIAKVTFSKDDLQELVDEKVEELAQTIQAIPLDKVKQAREEIDDLDRYFDNDYFSSNRDAMFKCIEVLEILDKLIESEG